MKKVPRGDRERGRDGERYQSPENVGMKRLRLDEGSYRDLPPTAEQRNNPEARLSDFTIAEDVNGNIDYPKVNSVLRELAMLREMRRDMRRLHNGANDSPDDSPISPLGLHETGSETPSDGLNLELRGLCVKESTSSLDKDDHVETSKKKRSLSLDFDHELPRSRSRQ